MMQRLIAPEAAICTERSAVEAQANLSPAPQYIQSEMGEWCSSYPFAVFAMRANKPFSKVAGEGGQPGMRRSTGRTVAAPPAQA